MKVYFRYKKIYITQIKTAIYGGIFFLIQKKIKISLRIARISCVFSLCPTYLVHLNIYFRLPLYKKYQYFFNLYFNILY